MKTLVAALLAGVAGGALAAPKAESATECGIAADMAIVARSLAQEAIKLPQAGAIMARIYDVSDSARDEADERHSRRRLRQQERLSQKFAEDLFTTCMKEGGNMDTVLGKRL